MHVPDIVEDHDVIRVELPQLLFETKILLRLKQPLNDAERRHEENAVSGLYQFVAHGAHQMRLAASRQSERKHVLSVVDESAFAESVQLSADHGRKFRLIERRQRFVRWKSGLLHQPFDFSSPAFLSLELGEIPQIFEKAPSFRLRARRKIAMMRSEGRQLEGLQKNIETHGLFAAHSAPASAHA